MLFCDGCGAPMDAPWDKLVVICAHCGAHNLPGQPGSAVPQVVPVDGRPRLNLGGRSYVLEAKLADGDSSIVYRGRWVVRLGELVVIKVLASLRDADRMRSEWDVLKELCRSTTQGAEHYITRLPAPVAHGIVDTDVPRTASVFGWKSGFVHTLTDVGEVHSSGVPGPVLVWILKRSLELLGWVHRSGFVHGAVTPDHILVHPRDHGAILVGWTAAVPWREGASRALPAKSARWSSMYGSHREATPALDISMATKAARTVAGLHLPGVTRYGPIDRVLDLGESGAIEDAWQLRDALVAASNEVFGPAAYNPLSMPGWR